MRSPAFILILFLFASCAERSSTDSSPAPDQIVRLSDSEIKGLDPQKISDLSSLRVAADQFEGLTRHDANGMAQPGLAKSWAISTNGLQWTFMLRKDLIFSDGSPITAQTFVSVFDRLQAKATASPVKALFKNIKSVERVGDKVFILLNSPTPQLPDLLTHPAMAAIPLHRVDAVDDSWTNDRPMITSGAYRLDRWQLNDHAKLSQNPEWHDEPAPTKNIIWKPMDDSLSGMRLFLAGGADVASNYPDSRHQWLKENHPGVVHSVPYLGSYYFAFNTRKPPFNDVRVRKALSMTVERKWIANKVIGIGNLPAWGLLPPGLVNQQGYKPEWADWPRDRRIAKARKLLAESGYSAKKPLKFEIRFNSSAEHRRVSIALAAMWKPLGVEASLFNSEAALHFAALRQHDFTLARSGWIADLPTPENFLLVHQTANGAGNYSGYDFPAFDAALSQAIAEPDPVKRKSLMLVAEKILAEDAPILPLYFYVTRSLVSDRITGWNNNISNVHPSRTLRIEAK